MALADAAMKWYHITYMLAMAFPVDAAKKISALLAIDVWCVDY